jgi:hypothetical protein
MRGNRGTVRHKKRWYRHVQTDRTIPSNKPDIIIRDNRNGTCMLIDVTVQRDGNAIQKEAKKILKNKDLTIEKTAYVEFKN